MTEARYKGYFTAWRVLFKQVKKYSVPNWLCKSSGLLLLYFCCCANIDLIEKISCLDAEWYVCFLGWISMIFRIRPTLEGICPLQTFLMLSLRCAQFFEMEFFCRAKQHFFLSLYNNLFLIILTLFLLLLSFYLCN